MIGGLVIDRIFRSFSSEDAGSRGEVENRNANQVPAASVQLVSLSSERGEIGAAEFSNFSLV